MVHIAYYLVCRQLRLINTYKLINNFETRRQSICLNCIEN